MSIDINWETITSGQEGAFRAEHIRAFVHDKFQQITLPRFIRSVHVHSFEFGSVCPDIIIKDICDPLPDFYETDDSSDDDQGEAGDEPLPPPPPRNPSSAHSTTAQFQNPLDQNLKRVNRDQTIPVGSAAQEFGKTAPQSKRQPFLAPAPRSIFTEQRSGPFSGPGTPGIPGGTSNLNSFHPPLSGLSGPQTPLAAVASGTPFSNHWNHIETYKDIHNAFHSEFTSHDRKFSFGGVASGSPTWNSNANPYPSPEDRDVPFPPSSPYQRSYSSAEGAVDEPDETFDLPPPPIRLHPAQPSDLQVVARVKYSGDVRMILTAEILLDYPMPSFVGIPLKLSITGMTFDGVAILASIRKRAHFCFLSPEDAEALLDAEARDNDHQDDPAMRQPGQVSASGTGGEKKIRSLLQEIRVESEIGRKENGKQVLKNVGKVEKFVLEQVRRIFEEELVFPSFWTFLV